MDGAACPAAIMTLVSDRRFVAQNGDHHVEVGLADDEAERPKDCSHRCLDEWWRIQFYDYDLRTGFDATVILDPAELVAINRYPGGVPPSPNEKQRAITLGLVDPSVAAAYARGSQWSGWLLDSGISNDECMRNRCVLARAWTSTGAMLAFWVNLHTGAVRLLSVAGLD